MNNLINIIVIISMLIAISKKKYQRALIIYCIACLSSPVFIINGYRISFEILVFPVILFTYLIKTNFIFNFSKEYRSLWYYVAAYVCISLIHGLINSHSISVATIYAIFRFAFTIMIIHDFFKKDIYVYTDNVLKYILALNFITSIYQMVNTTSVDLFYNLYYKPSLTPLSMQLKVGYFNRAFGVTGSPLVLGGLSALMFTFYLNMIFLNQKIRYKYIKLIMCCITGILALSKSAIITIPIITIIVISMSSLYGIKINIKKIFMGILFIAVIFIVLFFIEEWMREKGYAIDYYLNFLTNPFKALNTRYSSETGILSTALVEISKNPIIGVGYSSNNIFVGDSMYIVLLFETGIIGLITYAMPYVKSFIRAFKKRRIINISLIFAIWLLGVGNPLQVSFYIVIFAALAMDFGYK